jgi:hypothetical protein|tara:strand:- start:139 stop:276 length:138 start_codon:yes stop_codon:yes gene_type:complete
MLLSQSRNVPQNVEAIQKAFGIGWNDESQQANGHFAPFDWNGEVI